MKKVFSLCLLSFFLLSIMTSPGAAQKTSDIIEKWIKASGGRKVLEGIKDTTFSGLTKIIQMDLSGVVTFYHKEPNKLRQDLELMGMVMTSAFDGETAWQVNPQTGDTEELSDEYLEQAKREALGFGNSSILYPEKFGITFAYKGKEKIEDKDYIVLEQTFSDGKKTTFHIDPRTYLTYKTKGTALNQMGVEAEQEAFYSDYKKVDGVMFPHSVKIFQDGEEFIIFTVTEVSFNSGLNDSLFKMD